METTPQQRNFIHFNEEIKRKQRSSTAIAAAEQPHARGRAGPSKQTRDTAPQATRQPNTRIDIAPAPTAAMKYNRHVA